MTPEEGLRWFSTLAPSHIKMGLERVRAALDALGHPERDFPAIHVAGTNGKGSTCAILASCLRQRYRTGLYTSPHLARPNERIQIDGVEIDDRTFGQRIVEVRERLGSGHAELTYFEFGTLVAFWHFAKEEVDVAVLETGLGGRLDATTACFSVATCITAIDFDHQEYLGDTLEAIASEKAGILKRHVPAVLSVQADRWIPQNFRTVPLLVEGRDFSLEPSERGLRFSLGARIIDGLELGLLGAHQRQNLSLALATLLSAKGFRLSDDEVRAGVKAARWPGRLELVVSTPRVLLDGAHNPSGAQVLRAALDDTFEGEAVHLVFGVFADKDAEPMMRSLFPRATALYLAPMPSPRSRAPATYEALARTLCPRVLSFESAEAAFDEARRSAGAGLVVVAGSLFLIGQLRGRALTG